jgi:hypothetical protein
MAFTVPNFNIRCNISSPPVPNTPGIPVGPYRNPNVACNLAWGRRTNSSSLTPAAGPVFVASTTDLLMPKLTDIRGPQDTVSYDMVEVPAGSGRWYVVTTVDDVGKGFVNEYRIAVLLALAGSWTAPYP